MPGTTGTFKDTEIKTIQFCSEEYCYQNITDHKRKVNLGNNHEMAQSEQKSNSKIRGRKKLNYQPGIYTKKTYRKLIEQLT